MSYVLVLITVFSASGAVDSNTAFQEFASRQACERAADEIRRGVSQLAGTLGRDVIAQCHALGTGHAAGSPAVKPQ
jgi:hypothetical protein